jgi:hypothetical protein
MEESISRRTKTGARGKGVKTMQEKKALRPDEGFALAVHNYAIRNGAERQVALGLLEELWAGVDEKELQEVFGALVRKFWSEGPG